MVSATTSYGLNKVFTYSLLGYYLKSIESSIENRFRSISNFLQEIFPEFSQIQYLENSQIYSEILLSHYQLLILNEKPTTF